MDWTGIAGTSLGVLMWLYKQSRSIAAEAALAAERRQVLVDGKLTNEELRLIATDVILVGRPWMPKFLAGYLIDLAVRAAKRGWRKATVAKSDKGRLA